MKVENAAELVGQAQDRSGGSLNGRSRHRRSRQRVAQGQHAARPSPPPRRCRRRATCWSPARASARRRRRPRKIAGVRKVLVAESADLRACRSPRPSTPRCCRWRATTTHILVAGHRRRARTSPPRIAAKLDVAPISDIIEVVDARHLRAPDLRRQRAGDHPVVGRQEGDHRARDRLQGRPARAASAPIETVAAGAGAPQDPRFVSDEIVKSDRPELAAAQDRRLRRPRHGLGRGVPPGDRPAGRQARRGGGRLAARRSTPATRRTTIRSARPARSSRPSSTSPSASPAPSSTWPA